MNSISGLRQRSCNILDDESCEFDGIDNLFNTDPGLLRLGYFGGVNWTHALRYNSPATNGYSGVGCTPKDQRRVNRAKYGDDERCF